MTWEKVELAKVAETTSGGTPARTKAEYWGGSIPWVKSGELRDGFVGSCEEFITEIGLKNSSAKLFAPGTLLLALYGATAGKLAILGFPASTNQAVCGITPDEKVLGTKYLYYFLLSKRAQIIKDSFGGAQPNISQGYVRNLKVPLPPLAEQQRIADTLDTADALRRKDQELLRKYDELAQSIFYEMFGDPERNTEGWNVQKFGSLIHNIKAGTSLGGEDRELHPGEFGVLKISAVTTGIFKPQEYKVPAQADIVKERVTVKKGDLLFSRANTRELVGAVAIVEDTYPNLMLPDKLWRIDLHADQMLNYYCKAILTDKSVRYTLTQTATGSSGSMLNISMGKLRDLEIPVPPLELQAEFETASKKLLAQKRLVEKAATQSEYLFTSLLGSYFA